MVKKIHILCAHFIQKEAAPINPEQPLCIFKSLYTILVNRSLVIFKS